jgi:hypothetical protein
MTAFPLPERAQEQADRFGTHRYLGQLVDLREMLAIAKDLVAKRSLRTWCGPECAMWRGSGRISRRERLTHARFFSHFSHLV